MVNTIPSIPSLIWVPIWCRLSEIIHCSDCGEPEFYTNIVKPISLFMFVWHSTAQTLWTNVEKKIKHCNNCFTIIYGNKSWKSREIMWEKKTMKFTFCPTYRSETLAYSDMYTYCYCIAHYCYGVLRLSWEKQFNNFDSQNKYTVQSHHAMLRGWLLLFNK
jgi:hypothetical protein